MPGFIYSVSVILKKLFTNKAMTYRINFFISIDATHSTGLGRMVNDSPKAKANSKMKKVVIDGKTYLCLFATCDIEIGTELRYDYGVPNLPWRKKGTT